MNALINSFITTSAKGTEWLLVWSWQAVILLGGVWAGLKFFRVKSPALRYQIWLLALIAVVVTPILSEVGQLPHPQNRALHYMVELPRILVTNTSEFDKTMSPSVTTSPLIKRAIILSLLFVLWLAGLVAFLTRAVMKSLWLCRFKARASSAPSGDIDCDEFECEALRNGKTRLSFSSEIRSPIILGVLQPIIIFPADITIWTSPVERMAMLRHELAHIERRDQYLNLLLTILGAFFYFHPLARYACHQLEVERETACDDQVIESGAEAEMYAECIIKAAERGIGASRGAHNPALFSTRQILERRIEMIMNKDRIRILRHRWPKLVISGAMIIAISALLIPGNARKIDAQPISKSYEQAYFINSDSGEKGKFVGRFSIDVTAQGRDVPPPPPPPPPPRPGRHSKNKPPPPPPPVQPSKDKPPPPPPPGQPSKEKPPSHVKV